jgi:hypothetical protein
MYASLAATSQKFGSTEMRSADHKDQRSDVYSRRALKEESESEEGGADDFVYIPYSTAARMSPPA